MLEPGTFASSTLLDQARLAGEQGLLRMYM